jgi:hypothetical protein
MLTLIVISLLQRLTTAPSGRVMAASCPERRCMCTCRTGRQPARRRVRL